jgi:hypothetical protein
MAKYLNRGFEALALALVYSAGAWAFLYLTVIA